MRNLKTDELTKRKISQDILESTLVYYNTMIRFSIEDEKTKKNNKRHNESYIEMQDTRDRKVEKKNLVYKLLEKYYDNVLKKISQYVL